MGRRIEYEKGQVLGDHGIEFVEDIPNDPKDFRRAKFKCHCGNEFVTSINSIKSNQTASCGCNQNRKKEYIEGQKVGDHGIEFVEEVPVDSGRRRAKFKCHCGKIFENTIIAINCNQTKSCGCLFRGNIKYEKGQALGNYGITFVRHYPDKSKDRKAVFKCHCGKEFITTISKVKTNYQKGCGCGQGGKRKEYEAGQKIGSYGFVFLKWVDAKVGREQVALVRCHCGREYTATVSRIVNDYTKSCGCNNGKDKWVVYQEGQILGDYGIRFVRDSGKNQYGQRQAIFKCWCGNEFRAGVNTIKCGCQKTCGNHSVWNRIKYTKGQILGDYGITFIKNAGTNKHSQREAVFKCYCGKEFITEINNIKTNKQRSCGCANDEPNWRRIEYTTGQPIGSYGIQFIKDVDSADKKRRRALIRCHCGKEFVTTIQNVRSDITTSCGCSSTSLGENKIMCILKSKNIEFRTEHKEEKCRDKGMLPFDFAIKRNSQVAGFIEYDGLHHFEPIEFFGGQKHFLYVKKHDQIKDDYCETNNIPLLRVPYTEFNNIDFFVNSFLVELGVA